MLLKTNTIIGHRGCLDVAQNNTIEAFLKAKELGAEMVEMDIRRTRDGVLVVWHDAKVGFLRTRGTDFAGLQHEANQMGMVLPSLEEVLKRLEGKLQLDIELKETGYEEEVVGLILKYFTPNEFVITSFLDDALLKVKARFPTVKTGLIIGIGSHNMELCQRGWRRIKQLLSEIFPWKRMSKCQADFLAANWKLLFYGLAGRARHKDIAVIVWTVDSPKMITQLLNSGMFSGIVSNYPGVVNKLINNR